MTTPRVTTPRILATSGGFLGTERFNAQRPGGLVLEALRLTGKERPKVTLVMTASSDDHGYLATVYDALGGLSCDVRHLEVKSYPNADPRARILGSDLVWVGGGSVANLLALWRVHGVDLAMREAWEAGVVLAGVSAGSICWHVGGPTDSFGPTLAPVTDALGLLPFGNGVHYDSEAQRRPLLHRLVGDATLPTAFATDDHVGILYEGTEPVAVLTDEPVDPEAGPAAYRVERVGGHVVETRLAPGPLR
jgi:peptidase E